MSREGDVTFLYVGNLNFWGKPDFCLLRAVSKVDFYLKEFGGYHIPALNELTAEQIKAFAHCIVRMYELKTNCFWDTDIRTTMFILNCGERFIDNDTPINVTINDIGSKFILDERGPGKLVVLNKIINDDLCQVKEVLTDTLPNDEIMTVRLKRLSPSPLVYPKKKNNCKIS